METKVYYANIRALENPELFAKVYGKLMPERRRKTDEYRVQCGKNQSAGAGFLLQKALLDAGLSISPISYGEHGKPYFPAYPDFHFNLAHSGDYVLCAVSQRPVGCDVEKIGTNTIASRRFSPQEQAWLAQYADSKPFFRLWALKESYLKAIGKGLKMPLNAFSICMEGEYPTVDKGVFQFRELPISEDYACACCFQTAKEVKLIQTDFYRI